MLSTSSASAARQASRKSSTVVACGCSCTPTLNCRAMTLETTHLHVGEFDAAAAVAQHERGLAGQESPKRGSDQLVSPAGTEGARVSPGGVGLLRGRSGQ